MTLKTDAVHPCEYCVRDELGFVLDHCPEGEKLRQRDAATPPGSNPDVFRQYSLHVWGVEVPPATTAIEPAQPDPAPELVSGGTS